MTTKLINLPDAAIQLRHVHGFATDFTDGEVATTWTTTATDSGGAAPQSAAGGGILLDASDGTVADNDEVYYFRTQETLLFADGKPIEWEANLEHTEANTDDANFLIGVSDAWAADILQDAGAGPKTTASAFGFYSVDGSTSWRIIVSNGTSQTLVALTAANTLNKTAYARVATTNIVFKATCNPHAANQADFDFFINGDHVYRVADFDYSSSPTEMAFGFGVKNGGANEETLTAKYARCHQKV